jgi:hypothetical protein
MHENETFERLVRDDFSILAARRVGLMAAASNSYQPMPNAGV